MTRQASELRRPNLAMILLLLLIVALEGIEGRLLDTSVACDQHNFILSLNFDTPFRGLVYSEEGFPNCIYVNGTMLSHLNYQLKIPLHGCETRINLDGNFENGIIIQDNVGFLQATDKKYLLTCIPSTQSTSTTTSTTTSTLATLPTADSAFPGQKVFPSVTSQPSSAQHAFGRENSVTVDFGGVTVDQSLASTELVRGTLPPAMTPSDGSSESGSPVPELKYTVEIRAGHSLDSTPINNALNIGDPISYVVRLRKPVSESQIGRCWASDSKSSLELSDEHGCSLQPRGNIWGPFERVDTQSELVFVNRIKAWAFPTSNEVNIFCNLRVCMSRHCSFATNCSEITHQQNERHRREGGGFEEIETLRTSIWFRPKRQIGEQQQKTDFTELLTAYPELLEQAESWCLSMGQIFLVGASCCAASICLTLMATFIIFFRFCQDQGKWRNPERADTSMDIWTLVNELRMRSQQKEQQDGHLERSRHAI